MPSVDELTTEELRDALRLLGLDEGPSGGTRRDLREHLSTPGVVTDLLDRAPDGAAEAFRALAVEGAASVEDLLSRGWAGVGQLPAPLDWLQRRALVMVGRSGLVHAGAEAREGFATLTLTLPEPVDEDDPTPLLVEAATTVVIAPTQAALDRAMAVPGAALRTVSQTVAVSDRSPAAVQAALESVDLPVSGEHATVQAAPTLSLPGIEEEAVGPRAIRALVTRALEEERQLRLEYFASSRGGQATERVVDPWRFADDLLVGYCHLRDGERSFAIDRIGHARLLTSQRTHAPEG